MSIKAHASASATRPPASNALCRRIPRCSWSPLLASASGGVGFVVVCRDDEGASAYDTGVNGVAPGAINPRVTDTEFFMLQFLGDEKDR